jgi:hypothetical protein
MTTEQKPPPRGVVRHLKGLGEWTDDGYLSIDLAYEDGDLVLTVDLAQHVVDNEYFHDTERYVLTPKE